MAHHSLCHGLDAVSLQQERRVEEVVLKKQGLVHNNKETGWLKRERTRSTTIPCTGLCAGGKPWGNSGGHNRRIDRNEATLLTGNSGFALSSKKSMSAATML